MPSISLSSPGVPTLLTGLSPIAANPIAAIDGVASSAFASVIDGLGQGFTLDASPALMPAPGTTLPPDRPDIAGGPAQLPELDVEAVMVGSNGTVPPLPSAPASAEAPIDGPTADAVKTPATPVGVAEPELPVAAPTPDSEPIACGLQVWRPGAGPHLAPKSAPPLPMPLQLPPEETPDLPAVDPAPLPEKADKPVLPEPAPSQVASVPLPEAPPFAWAPPLPPQPADEAPQPPATTTGPSVPAPVQPTPTAVTAAADAKQPVLPKLGAEAAPATPQPAQAPAAQPNPLPNSFTLPPDVAREIAQLVKAAVGEPDERRSSDASDSAPLPAAQSALPPVAPSQPAPVHPSFAAQRPVIDTGRAEWMQAMIDKISEMPQAEGGRRDAQIRLVPDALGPVEVKIEQRQERLHVTLQAETPQARQLLSDAAPKLHELAEARGIRFAQAGFGSADSQDRRHAPDQQQQPSTPLRPRPAASADAGPTPETDGDLIA